MNAVQDGQSEADFVSSLPDYAQVFMFLRQFGAFLAIPPVSLSELEDFFVTRHSDEENEVGSIHWRLLMSVMRRESRRDWNKMAIRFAVQSGVINHSLPYSEIPVDKRVKVMKLSCEAQFDCNLPFRAELKKLELASDKPVGVDSLGQRYWLLQDSCYDLRLYRESGYDVLPPEGSSWVLLARSVDELDVRIADLASKRNNSARETGTEEEEVGKMEVDAMESDQGQSQKPQTLLRTRAPSRAKKEGRKGKIGAKRHTVSPENGGCCVCGVDNDYQNMLLCDSCDGECHMYCHYPRLWAVPRGKWQCPLCDERALVERLRETHTQLAAARCQVERAAERKQRNVIRLQKTGLLLQNIILSDSGRERTRRARKVVNYAELNDVYLPPLGPSDFIASAAQPSGPKSSGERVAHCVGTRASRRLRDMSAELEQYSINRAELSRDPVDGLPNTTADLVATLSPITHGAQEACQSSRCTSDVGFEAERGKKDFSVSSSTLSQHSSSLVGDSFAVGARVPYQQGDMNPVATSMSGSVPSLPGSGVGNWPTVDSGPIPSPSRACNGLTAASSQDIASGK